MVQPARELEGNRSFPSTRWTLILSAKETPEAKAAAMQALLAAYWKPLYFYVRRKGLDTQSAQDAVQDLLVRLFEKDFLDRVDREKGKLRSYLMSAANNLLANRHEKESALKRGGGMTAVPLDFDLAERHLAAAPEAAESAFQQEWAAAVMERALERLRAEFESGERRGPFEIVLLFFKPDGEPPSYKEIAARHKMSMPQLKAFLHRARTRFRELVREEVADTAGSSKDADEEMNDLLRILSA